MQYNICNFIEKNYEGIFHESVLISVIQGQIFTSPIADSLTRHNHDTVAYRISVEGGFFIQYCE